MRKEKSGTFTTIDGNAQAFIPALLPPTLNKEKFFVLGVEASRQIGLLDGLGRKLKNPRLLMKSQLMKEAVQSSKIEGSQVSLSDLYQYQLSRKVENEQQEVINCADALEMALHKVSNGQNIDLDLLNECHKMLFRGVRGNEILVGKLRKRQNWIGKVLSNIETARYVPPPPDKVPKLMENLIMFINSSQELNPLIRCAIVHSRFEAIHPYDDGNGRIGRLLIPLMLSDLQLLQTPLLYISEYIYAHQQEYYDLLLGVSHNNDWYKWINFFLKAMIHQARISVALLDELDELHAKYIKTIYAEKRTSTTRIKIIDMIFKTPFITRSLVRDELNVNDETAKNNLAKLVDLGILEILDRDTRSYMYLAREVYNLINR